MTAMENYSKIGPGSEDTVLSSLKLLNTPPTHTSILKSERIIVHPLRAAETDTLEFRWPGAEDAYLDPGQIYLKVTIKVKTADAANLNADAGQVHVACGDDLFASLFKSVKLNAANQVVEYHGEYPYKKFFDDLLNYGTDAKKTFLAGTTGWIEDGCVGHNTAQFPEDNLTARKGLIVGSKPITFFGPLALGLFNQDRLFPPGLGFELELKRSDPAFCLLAADNNPAGGARIEITKAELHINKCIINPSIHNSMKEARLLGDTCKYPFSRSSVRAHVIPAGVATTRLNLDTRTQKPTRTIIGIVNHRAKGGSYELNPFKFANHGLTKISLEVDGISNGHTYEPDFPNDDFTEAFVKLVDGVKSLRGDSSNGITKSAFKERAALYAFETTPDKCDDGLPHLIQKCSLTLLLEFANALENPVSVIVYQEMDELVEFDNEFRVTNVTGVF